MIPAFLSGLNPDGTAYLPRSSWAIYASHIETGGSRYMSRWIVQTPFGTVKLHHIHRADADQHPHDHVADFWSFILSGGYRERRHFPPHPLNTTTLADGTEVATPNSSATLTEDFLAGRLLDRRAEDYHRIIGVLPNTWTLVWFGPKRKSWSFLTADGPVPWRRYLGLEAA